MLELKKPRILVIASSFAPSTAVGAKRFTFLSPILKKNYNKLDVLTRKEKYFPSKDFTLPVTGNIHRVGMYPPYPIKKNKLVGKIYNRLWSNYLCLIDPFSGWILPAFYKGLKIVKNEKIDLIIATCPTSSSIVIGFLIGFISKTKFIIDYRDPWTLHDQNFCKILGRRISKFLEKLAIRHASALVFCTRIMKKEFMESLGKYTKSICRIVPSGFYNRDMVKPLYLGEKKNMIYAGKLYGERRMKLLAKPLFQLLGNGVINKENFCFHHFGECNNEDRELIDKYELQGIIKRHPQVSYEQMIRYLKGADILFLPSGSDVNYAIPFKFYDYLSVKRPILVVAHEKSAVAEMMREIDCGRLSLINNKDSITENLRAMLIESKEYSFSGAEKYTWENSGKKYLEVIEEVCGRVNGC
jgi:glycosyltransferase involved in cell wall biosynthesis